MNICKTCKHEETDVTVWCKDATSQACTEYKIHATKENVEELRQQINDLKATVTKEPDTKKIFIIDENNGQVKAKEIEFKNLKLGDRFLLVDENGTPVPNDNGSFGCVALDDTSISKKRTLKVSALIPESLKTPTVEMIESEALDDF